MSVGRRIIKNTVILSSGQVLAKIISIVLLLILTRMLGKSGFGLYSFAFAFGSMFMLFTHFGINTLLVREVARDKSKAPEFIGHSLTAVLIFSALTFILINSVAYFSGLTLEELQVIFIFSIYIIFDGISRYFISIFRAFERMEYEVVVNVIDRTGLLIWASVTWLIESNLIVLLIGFSSVGFLKLISAYLLVNYKFLKLRLKWAFGFITSVLKESYPFAMAGLFTSIIIRIDTIILKYFHTDEVIGLYNAAKRLTESLSFIPENIAFALFPALSAIYLVTREKFNHTFQQTFEMMIILAIPITSGIFILAPQFIQLLYTPEFHDAYIALRWLSIALGLYFLKYTFNAILSSIGKQLWLSLIIGIGMILNVILNYILIPEYQIFGAGLATVIAESVIVLLTFVLCRKFLGLPRFSIRLLKTLFVGLVIILFIYSFRHFNIFIIVASSFVLYIILVLVSGVISKQDRQYYFELIKKKTNFKINKYES